MAASVKIAWNGAKLVNDVLAAADVGAQRAAEVVQLRIQTNISVVGPPHSMPGEFPHLITGKLQDSVKVAPGKRQGERKVVVEAPYALHLEFGTIKMAPRPFIVRSMNEARDEAVEAFVDPIKDVLG